MINQSKMDGLKYKYQTFQGLPSYAYYEPNIFQQEKERIFYKKWIFVGHVTQIQQPGQYFVAKIADQNVVVIRGEDHQVYAFHNACLHRGHELLQGEGKVSQIVCPYHGWSYRSNGKLAMASYSNQVEGFDVNNYCLPRVQLHEICGLIFLNLDPEATPFIQDFPDLEESLRTYIPNIDELRIGYSQQFSVNSNWKNLLENSVDNYHTAFVHPPLSKGIKMSTYKHILKENYAFCISDTNKTKTVYQFAEEDYEQFVWWFIWPSVEIATFPGKGMRLYRMNPDNFNQSHQYFSYLFTNGMPNEQQMDCINTHVKNTNQEDIEVLDAVQRGQSSLGYEKSLFMIKSEAIEWDERIVYHMQQLTKKALNL